MRRSAGRIVVILVLAAGAGFLRARELPWVPDLEELEQKQELHQELRATAGITLERFRTLIEQGAVVIDARPAEAFEEGHLDTGGFPPVLNVPPGALDQNIDRLMELQGYPIVLYCTSEICDYAEELYAGLTHYGFFDMKIYFPGWEGILAAGLPTTTGPDTWTGFDQPPGDDPNGEPNASAEQPAEMPVGDGGAP